MNCDACGSTNSSNFYFNIGEGEERKLLQEFIAKKSGKEIGGGNFEFCVNCEEE